MFKKIITIVPVAALLTVGATAQASTITVEKGDTLWGLARENNTTVETIQTVNHLTSDLIYPGDLLTIAKEKQHTVKLGDTLWDIAIEHDVTVSQIKDWNNLQTDLIHPGLNLVIYVGAKASAVKGTSTVAAPAQKSKESVPATNNSDDAPKTAAPVSSTTQPTGEATAPVSNNEAVKESAPESSAPAQTEGAKEIMVEATAYTASCEGCTGITSTGINLLENPDAKVISVDPTVIPLGSKVFVEGYGEAIAGDTGGGIKGNKIDVFIPSKQEAINFGVKQLKVTILD
ncbi:LysM peptidoglycan-binding and 3D domain-containing protein [Ureibacillus chungkukjangi]|uniref:3D (Asp-Asp-Asp) domain-containing protein n=1 Tax=Ureibacillus chungkukjangi TaxID=1202712 RepID=A0A318TTG8_9BACL|nr:3D domain-containing protein [Ureibacillus chungkukjangi]MCM3389379.1 LysM peptidoglycan-binding domain-containing protein [Ureibacillus chungkukjangi]PYF05145.1 3D (Asp-Asp-Asp) domain-containing protein [Ureibacillus chungkukjangi]